jgi:hypothetical protein
VPPWEIREVRFDLLPWSAWRLASGEHFLCPGCRRQVSMAFQGQPGIPYTERFGEQRD